MERTMNTCWVGGNLNKPRGDHEMASVRQLEANRANARKSTGPRTETGKAIARLKRAQAWVDV